MAHCVIFALLPLLLQPCPASTIIIDEPELGLHPYAIKLLASLLHEAAERSQLLVSTQASLLLDEFFTRACDSSQSSGR